MGGPSQPAPSTSTADVSGNGLGVGDKSTYIFLVRFILTIWYMYRLTFPVSPPTPLRRQPGKQHPSQLENSRLKMGYRLDDMNDAIRQFFGGKLSFAPLEELQPAAILEIG